MKTTQTLPDPKSSFVPNTYQTPNDYVDEYLSLLSGEEWKVLIYATRRILGFQKRQDRISLSQFTDGTKRANGEWLDHGTGLSVATVKKCLDSLTRAGLMVRLQENDPKTNEGILWTLQWDKDKVDKIALTERAGAKAGAYARKMSKARSMRHTPSNDKEGTPPNGIEDPPANGIETQNPGKPKPSGKPEAAGKPPRAGDIPEVVLFREVTGKYPARDTWGIVCDAMHKVAARLNRAPAATDLLPFWNGWRGPGFSPTNLAWLTEWAVAGSIPGKRSAGARRVQARAQETQDERERRINAVIANLQNA